MTMTDCEIRLVKLISPAGSMEEPFRGLASFLKEGDGEGDVTHLV